MTNLVNFQCIYSKISVISNKIGNLINIRTLSFEENNISELPREISNLTKMRIASFSKNNIKYFPSEITRLPNLNKLYIYSNPCCSKLPFFNNCVKIFK